MRNKTADVITGIFFVLVAIALCWGAAYLISKDNEASQPVTETVSDTESQPETTTTNEEIKNEE